MPLPALILGKVLEAGELNLEMVLAVAGLGLGMVRGDVALAGDGCQHLSQGPTRTHLVERTILVVVPIQVVGIYLAERPLASVSLVVVQRQRDSILPGLAAQGFHSSLSVVQA